MFFSLFTQSVGRNQQFTITVPSSPIKLDWVVKKSHNQRLVADQNMKTNPICDGIGKRNNAFCCWSMEMSLG